MSKTDPQKHFATRKLQRQTRVRVEASGLVAHAGCVESHISRESAPTWANVDRRIPSLRRGHRGDQEVFQGRLQHSGTLGFPSHKKEKARESAKAKEKKERATKEKERANCVGLVSIHLVDRHLITCRTATKAVTRRNGADCNRQGRARMEDGERPQRDQRTMETQIVMKEVNSGGGTRFDVLEVTMNSGEDFRVLKADVQNGTAKQASTIKFSSRGQARKTHW